VNPSRHHTIHVVSAERNAGEYALNCLNSVYRQEYDRTRIKHVFIDDASDEQTDDLIRRWLETHSGHRVEYIRRNRRSGGCENKLFGFRMAPAGSIILELNGDDWLHDSAVFNFLNKVYSDPDIWITYNTPIYSSGIISMKYKPFPSGIIKSNRFRSIKKWRSGHLHTFRQELFNHLDEKDLIDPLTGEYWANADDQAFYLPLFEMAGQHCLHTYRINYVYNITPNAEQNIDVSGQLERARRIQAARPYQPLGQL
jgi:glycosyltransferase involved in cell wall biosynthesis